MFVGRKVELENLNKLYNSNNFEMVVVYGRRRIGKTMLLAEFCKDKRHIFFSAQQMNYKLNMEKISKNIQEAFNQELLSPFIDFEASLEFIYKNNGDERLVFVIDEFPYLAKSELSILSTLQHFIDHFLQNSMVMLVLCGSSIGFMEEKVLGYKSPLFGRRTFQIEIKPLTIFEVAEMFPDYTSEELIAIYSIIGGTPHYLAQFSKSMSLEENIKDKILLPGSYLYTEPLDLLKQELRNVYTYNSVLTAIARGKSRLNEIVTTINEKSDIIANCLRVLNDLKITERLVPITEKESSRKTIYRIRDNLFRFYFKYIVPNKELLDQGDAQHVYEDIMGNISEYIGSTFEDICIQYMWKLNINRKLPFVFKKIGKWWGTNNNTKKQTEFDFIGLGENEAIFGECKYRNEKTGLDILEGMIFSSTIFNYSQNYFIIISKSGFKNNLKEYAKKSNRVFLVTADEIFNRAFIGDAFDEKYSKNK